jgi:HEAT repeat protein
MGRRRYLDPSLNFVLDTFIEMNLREDNEIYSLAKTIASDSTYAEATRSAAIRLFASLGSRADFELLTSYLDSDSESVKASALEGIEILHRKITGSDNQ